MMSLCAMIARTTMTTTIIAPLEGASRRGVQLAHHVSRAALQLSDASASLDKFQHWVRQLLRFLLLHPLLQQALNKLCQLRLQVTK
jgi:hypothetical protein